MPIKLCTERRCPNPAHYKGRCAIHARAQERSWGRHREIYDTAKWRHTRKAQLARTPICERCDSRLAAEVHHRQALEDGGHPWHPDNLESLCKSCHSTQTRKEQQQRARA